MAFQHYTIEPIPGARGFRIVGHWGLTRVLLHAVTSLREAVRRQPDAEVVDNSADSLASRSLRGKVARQAKRWL